MAPSNAQRDARAHQKYSSVALCDTPSIEDGVVGHAPNHASSWSAWILPRRLSMALAAACIFAASMFWLNGAGKSALSQSAVLDSPQQDSSPLDVAWPLHPQAHSGRKTRTIVHQWNITSGWRRPDGVKKEVYLINDNFPGPTVEAAPGDTLEVLVFNGLQNESIAIHWHGLHMRGANQMDGAVSITQSPIEPGHSFIYRFEISSKQHGTFWYHAHDRVQRADGLYGGLVIHPTSDHAAATIRDRLLLIGDWYHQTSQKVLDRYLEPGSFGNEPVPDSIVLNDKGAYNCSAASPARPVDCINTPRDALPVLALEPGRLHRLRVVNTGTLAGFTIALPGIDMSAVEVDGGQLIKAPITNRVGVLYPGQRVDIVINATATQKSYLEIDLDDENFRDPNPALTSTQRFLVQAPEIEAQTTGNALETLEPVNLLTIVSRGAPAPDFPLDADHTLVVYTNTMKFSHRENLPFGYINQTSWSPQQRPLRSMPRSQWDQNQLVPFIPRTKNGAWVDLVINNIDDGGHPFHLHGFTFYVLQISQKTSFWGSYNPFAEKAPPQGPLNLQNPIQRDTVFVPARGYAVLRFKADNEGLWFAHCHLLSHQAAGMAMTIQVGGDEELGFG